MVEPNFVYKKYYYIEKRKQCLMYNVQLMNNHQIIPKIYVHPKTHKPEIPFQFLLI